MFWFSGLIMLSCYSYFHNFAIIILNRGCCNIIVDALCISNFSLKHVISLSPDVFWCRLHPFNKHTLLCRFPPVVVTILPHLNMNIRNYGEIIAIMKRAFTHIRINNVTRKRLKLVQQVMAIAIPPPPDVIQMNLNKYRQFIFQY